MLVRSPIGMYTDSMLCRRRGGTDTSGCRPTPARCASALPAARRVNRSASAARTSFGRFVIASNESTPRTCIHSSICRTRNGGDTTSAERPLQLRGREIVEIDSAVTSSLAAVSSFVAAGASGSTRRADFTLRVGSMPRDAEQREIVHVDAELHFLRRRRAGRRPRRRRRLSAPVC